MPIDVLADIVFGQEAMHEIRDVILDADHHVILARREVIDPFQQVIPHTQDTLVGTVPGQTLLLVSDQVSQKLLDVLVIPDSFGGISR